jgi:nitroreductase
MKNHSLEFLRKRRSIRSFKENTIEESKFNHILEACNLAPSSGGLQTFEIYQIKNQEIKERLISAAQDQTFVAQAPLLLVFCANPSHSVERFGEMSLSFLCSGCHLWMRSGEIDLAQL